MRSKKEIEDSIKKDWDEAPLKGILPGDMKERMWMNVQKATIYKRKRNYRWIAAACAVLLLSVLGYQSFSDRTFSPAATVATKTFPDDIRLLRLPDGTRVWVNENTEIQYPEQFADNRRAVALKGEAFFEVAKDPSRPFIITSGAITTTVLGTSFNVKAYAGAQPEVHVRTGKVKVEGGHNTVFLEKGYAAMLPPGGKAVRKQKIDVLEPEWKKVLIDVDGLTLGQVVETLQPIHAFTVEYASQDLKGIRLEGIIDTRQGFDKMLQTVAFALELEIKPIGNNRYVVIKYDRE